MHILLLNEYYPPDTSATANIAAQVAEVLAQHHKVTVLAGRPSYDPERSYPFALLRREIRNNVLVERVGSTAYSRRRMSRRLSNYLSYLALAVPRALLLRCDLILAMTDPPVAGIAGAWISRISGRPFVYNIRDLYPDMVLGDDMRDRILSKGIAVDRVCVVRDGAVPVPPLPGASDPAVQEIRCGFPFVALHAGNLGFYGAWQTLLKAAEILGNTDNGIVFVGDGANRANLESSAAGLPNVRFLPFRPAAQLRHVMAAGDVQIITLRRGLEGVVVPSKLYSILAAGRPILAVVPPATDVARITRSSDCGVVADPDDPRDVAEAIHNLSANPERLAEMGRRAREAAAKYARVNELNLFAAILEEVVQDGSTRPPPPSSAPGPQAN